MVLNKIKLLAASGLAVVGLAGAGAVHMVSAQTPAPAANSTTHSQVTTGNDKEVSDTSSADSDNVNNQQGDQKGSDKETNDKSSVDTDNVNNQQGDQLGPDSNTATDPKD
jgi:hypothetical protein